MRGGVALDTFSSWAHLWFALDVAVTNPHGKKVFDRKFLSALLTPAFSREISL
jgi:hypothetical protein